MITFDKLWETMKAKNISTYTLREKYNIDNRTIRRLKANQNMTTDTLNKLCNILECDLGDIATHNISIHDFNSRNASSTSEQRLTEESRPMRRTKPDVGHPE